MSSVSTFGGGKRVNVVLIYQSLLGIYGDRGNATVIMKRLAWRGYDPVLHVVEPGDPLPTDGDVYLLGGGEDAAQISAVKELKKDGTIYAAAERGAAIFAVCAGYQILGKTFTVGDNDTVTPGLGLLDVTTTRGPKRAVGELLGRWIGHDGEEQWLTGFENHGGYTTLGPDARPVTQVEVGIGNDGTGTDGAQQGSVLAIYPHGPALARNPALADHVLETALKTELPKLERDEITELRRQRIAAARR